MWFCAHGMIERLPLARAVESTSTVAVTTDAQHARLTTPLVATYRR